MRVAILSSIAWRTPPRQYGPWEQVASNVTEGLVSLGYDVTLFASEDSLTGARLEATCKTPYAEDPTIDAKVAECLHISHLWEKAHAFDIIHNHFDFLPLCGSALIRTPMVTTIHGFSSPSILPVYQKYNAHTDYVSISDADRHSSLRYLATVYNGIDTDAFSFVAQPRDYLLFFGRITPQKGTKEAITVAQECGKKLIIAGLVQDEHYFQNSILPHVDGKNVVYAGNCGPSERNELLGNALGLLHLISFDEPFGLSVAEAMCCGTPVIATPRGSMPELIRPGKTGFLVQGVEEAAAAVDALPSIHRPDCRKWAMEMFSKEKMTEQYAALYQQILSR